MIKGSLIQWVESELKRLEEEERREKTRIAYESRANIKKAFKKI
jgi:hypothetical protein